MRTLPIQPDPSERGSAMLEFAFSAAIVFTLLFGTMLLALGLYTYEVINQYARDASRYAMVRGSGCSYTDKSDSSKTDSCNICTGKSPAASCSTAGTALQNFLNTEPYPGIKPSSLTVKAVYGMSPNQSANCGKGLVCCTNADCNGSGDQVTVTVSYPYLYSIPFIPSNSFTMKATSAMTISQ